MATTKITGKALTGTFGAVDLSSASRKFTLKAKSKEIDISTRDDLVAGARVYAADAPDYEFTWEGLDTTGGHAAVKTLRTGDIALLSVNTSQMSMSVEATITDVEYDSEMDKGAEWKLSGRLNAAPNWA